jgi:hypothetical protein
MDDCGCKKSREVTRRGLLKGGLAASVAAMLISMGVIRPKPAQAADCHWEWECFAGTWALVEVCCYWVSIWPWGWVRICYIAGFNRTPWRC